MVNYLDHFVELVTLIFAAVVGGFVVSYVSVIPAITQFRKEKLWEHNHEAYDKILKALARLKPLNKSMRDFFQHPEYREDDKTIAQHQLDYQEARRTLDDALVTAQLMANEQVTSALSDLRKAFSECRYTARVAGEDVAVEVELKAIEDCESRILAQARKDLGLIPIS
jgi:hypothetical protein